MHAHAPLDAHRLTCVEGGCGGRPKGHEREGGQEGAHGQACIAADAVAGGTAVADVGAAAYQQACATVRAHTRVCWSAVSRVRGSVYVRSSISIGSMLPS